jgi:hypothetical protein
MISGGAQSQLGKLFVGAFRFLQTDYVRLSVRKPGKQPLLPLTQRIDVPGDDFHPENVNRDQ